MGLKTCVFYEFLVFGFWFFRKIYLTLFIFLVDFISEFGFLYFPIVSLFSLYLLVFFILRTFQNLQIKT